MSTKPPDPTPPKSGGLWARLFGASAPQPAPSQHAQAPPPPPENAVDLDDTVAISTEDSVSAAYRDLADDNRAVEIAHQDPSQSDLSAAAVAEAELPAL